MTKSLGARCVQDLRLGHPRHPLQGSSPPDRGVPDRRGRGDQHGPARGAEDAVPQDQDRGHLHPVGGGHQEDPQQGEHEPSLQARHTRGLKTENEYVREKSTKIYATKLSLFCKKVLDVQNFKGKFSYQAILVQLAL